MSSKYEIQRSLGTGSFGQVYVAKSVKDNRQCVIKKIKTRDISEPEKKNIENQVKLLQLFQHINIVGYKDCFIDKDGTINIVMENCQEGDLYQMIRSTNGKRFEENQIIDWFIQICLAIFYLHERRILHRDLKTQNIFLTKGKVRLGDFGISKVLDQKQQLTSTVIGTPYYMSPQQFRYKPYSYKTDIWALGCMLYEMCNLRHAFDAQNLPSLSVKVLKGNYHPVNSQYSKPLRDLVSKLLSINPRDRPTIVQILKMPLLRKRLMMYVQGCLIQKKYDSNHLDTLKKQAEMLGLQFLDSVPKDLEPISITAPVTANLKTQRGQQSAKIHHKSSKQILDNKALEHRKKILQKQLSIEKHEKQKLEQQFKMQQKKKIVQKRQQILEKQKQRRKKIISNEKSHSSSSPNLALMKNKARYSNHSHHSNHSINNITNISTELPSEKSNASLVSEYKSIPLINKPSPVQSVVCPPVVSKSRIFKIQEQYDMNFEHQQPDHTIYELLQQEEQENQQKPKQSIIHEEIQNSVAEPTDMTGVMNMVNAINQKLKMKTSRINQLQTELLQIDFQVSEDSIKQEIKRPYNPKYRRIEQKITQLLVRIDLGIGKKKLEALDRISSCQKQNMSVSDHHNLKQKVVDTIGAPSLGYWHLMDQVIILKQSLKKIPQYL